MWRIRLAGEDSFADGVIGLNYPKIVISTEMQGAANAFLFVGVRACWLYRGYPARLVVGDPMNTKGAQRIKRPRRRKSALTVP